MIRHSRMVGRCFSDNTFRDRLGLGPGLSLWVLRGSCSLSFRPDGGSGEIWGGDWLGWKISRLRPADFARDDRKRPVFDMTSKGLSMR